MLHAMSLIMTAGLLHGIDPAALGSIVMPLADFTSTVNNGSNNVGPKILGPVCKLCAWAGAGWCVIKFIVGVFSKGERRHRAWMEALVGVVVAAFGLGGWNSIQGITNGMSQTVQEVFGL